MWVRRLYTTPDGRDLVAMDSRRRLFGGLLRRMLVLRDDVCTTPWCEAPIVHADHTTPAREGGRTGFEDGNGKCARCNQTKEAPGWRTRVILTEGHHATTSPDRDRDPTDFVTPTAFETGRRSRQDESDGVDPRRSIGLASVTATASERADTGGTGDQASGAGDHPSGAPVRVRTAPVARLGQREPGRAAGRERSGLPNITREGNPEHPVSARR